jgi:dTDP-N-acetylfucosamine:lipid II N-acetylfucosaminyltransferase
MTLSAMKILHLVVDDKFIDSAIREFELVRPGVHEFLILDARPPHRYLRSPSVRPISRAAWCDRVAQADVAAVVMHCLSVEHQPLLRDIPPGPKVIWIGWGYDYYGLASDAFPEGLLLPKTTALEARLRGRSPGAAPGSMQCSELSWARPYPKPSADAQAALRRVDYFSPVLQDEHGLVRRHQPTLRAQYLRWNYGTVEDDMSLPGMAAGVDASGRARLGPNLLVGNSATSANNHLELFDCIRRHVDLAGRQLIVPLSYGDAAYRAHIERIGRQLFGDAFVPLVDFLPKDRYIELLTSCGHVMMNHVRQQALGNLVISGLLGARLHLNGRSPLGPWLRRAGISVSDVERPQMHPLTHSEAAAQAAVLRSEFGREAQRRRTGAMVDVALSTRLSEV